MGSVLEAPRLDSATRPPNEIDEAIKGLVGFQRLATPPKLATIAKFSHHWCEYSIFCRGCWLNRLGKLPITRGTQTARSTAIAMSQGGHLVKPVGSRKTWAITYRDTDGALRWEGKFRTKSSARTRLSEVLTEIHKGTYSRPSSLSFEHFAAEWLLSRRQLRGSTKAGYSSLIDKQLVPRLGSMKVSRVKFEDIDAAVSGMIEDELASKTIHDAVRLLRNVLAGLKGPTAFRHGLAFADSTLGVKLEQFRSAQPGRTKLPESLWQAAVELARQHGVYPVAHPLRLDYTRLKKRLGGSPAQRRKATKPPFVELLAPARASLEECVIKFESSGGEQDANPVEGHRSARLDNPAAGLAGNDRMIQITAQMHVLVAIEAVDGTKGIPGVFVFRSRSGTAIRLLSYDGQGYWLAQKRLSKGRFVWLAGSDQTHQPLEHMRRGC